MRRRRRKVSAGARGRGGLALRVTPRYAVRSPRGVHVRGGCQPRRQEVGTSAAGRGSVTASVAVRSAGVGFRGGGAAGGAGNVTRVTSRVRISEPGGAAPVPS